MNIWIVTTGNSDVILKHDKNWGKLHTKADDKLERPHSPKAIPISSKDREEGYTVSSRVLGIVYGDQAEDLYLSDLKFPLLDTYDSYIKEHNIELDRIIVILTDQSKIFVTEEQRLGDQSPYWQDTCTLRPLFEWYFKHKEFGCIPDFLCLSPDKSNLGIDHWEATLTLIEKQFQTELFRPGDNTEKTVYVSHQAGTPAISSAVQFAALGNFKDVNFLVSNKCFNQDCKLESTAELIESSKYRRGLQIQQAKQLIESSLPGAALKLLEDISGVEETSKSLRSMVNFFNIRKEEKALKDGNEFDIEPAIHRIIDALELVTLFFDNKNYIQGITLLASAHETFLKAAIIDELYKKSTFTILINTSNIKQIKTEVELKTTEVVIWSKAGLGFVSSKEKNSLDYRLKELIGIEISQKEFQKKLNEIKGNILNELLFPINDEEICKSGFNPNKIGSNTYMFKWLEALKKNKFSSWKLLKFIGKYAREYEADRRNQLMHNLVGTNEAEVIRYLLGNPEDEFDLKPYVEKGVLTTYEEEVKQPFLAQIKSLELPFKESNLSQELHKIANELR